MSSISTGAFWKDTAERVVSTAAQAAIGAIGVSATLQQLDWTEIGGIAGLAAVVSLLKALVAGNIGDGTASLVDTAPVTEDASTTPDLGDTTTPTV